MHRKCKQCNKDLPENCNKNKKFCDKKCGKKYYIRNNKKGKLYKMYDQLQTRSRDKGYDLLPREEFYQLANNSQEFNIIFNKWKESNFKNEFMPTTDRKDPKLGYTSDNIQFLTWSENSIKGNLERKRAA